MTSGFAITLIVMLSTFSALIILGGICRFRLLLGFANYGPGPNRTRAIARAWDTAGTPWPTARSRQTRRQSALPSYSLQPRAGEISVSNAEHGVTNDDPQSEAQLSQMLRDLEQPPPAYQGSAAPSRPHSRMPEGQTRLEVEPGTWLAHWRARGY